MSSSAAVERARAFAHRHGRDRQLVERHRGDRRGLGESGPDIGEHDDHQRRQIEQHDQPGIGEPVGDAGAAHDEADRPSRAPWRWRTRRPRAPSVAPRLKASAPERASSDDRERYRLRVGQQARRPRAASRHTRPRSAGRARRAWRPSSCPAAPAGRTCRKGARVPDRPARCRRSRPAPGTGRGHRPPPPRAAGARCLRCSAGDRSRARRRRVTRMRGASRRHSGSEAARICLACTARHRGTGRSAERLRVGPGAVEGIADDRHRALGAERLHDLRPWRWRAGTPCLRARRRNSRRSGSRRSRPAAPSPTAAAGRRRRCLPASGGRDRNAAPAPAAGASSCRAGRRRSRASCP